PATPPPPPPAPGTPTPAPAPPAARGGPGDGTRPSSGTAPAGRRTGSRRSRSGPASGNIPAPRPPRCRAPPAPARPPAPPPAPPATAPPSHSPPRSRTTPSRAAPPPPLAPRPKYASPPSRHLPAVQLEYRAGHRLQLRPQLRRRQHLRLPLHAQQPPQERVHLPHVERPHRRSVRPLLRQLAVPVPLRPQRPREAEQHLRPERRLVAQLPGLPLQVVVETEVLRDLVVRRVRLSPVDLDALHPPDAEHADRVPSNVVAHQVPVPPQECEPVRPHLPIRRLAPVDPVI